MTFGVPIREIALGGGKPIRYVVKSDMPPKVAERFERAVCPCACPTVSGEIAFYAHDWLRWCEGHKFVQF